MRRMLVTGAAGELGRRIVPRAEAAGWQVRRMSRRLPSGSADWVQADLLTGEGIEAAVRDVDVIIHCASSPFENALAVEEAGTARLLAAAGRSEVARVVYVSIVGVDRSDFGYYRAKLAGEAVVAGSDIPSIIVRMSQFHTFIVSLLQTFNRGPVQFLPMGWRFQPLATEEAADILVHLAGAPDTGRAPDVAGPEVRSLDDLAASWMAITGQRRRVVRFPMPGSLSLAFRSGINLVPERPSGSVTWEQWLQSAGVRGVS